MNDELVELLLLLKRLFKRAMWCETCGNVRHPGHYERCSREMAYRFADEMAVLGSVVYKQNGDV